MLNIIKTAIITIIISFISGVLLDNYKNIAPRILCSIKKNTPIKLNNKVIKVYSLMVRNTSNKTIHHLTVNVQGCVPYDKLKINDEKITNGLKYDITSENNIYNVNIPFLSKDDEFSAKVLVQSDTSVNKRPRINLRCPENFKEINSKSLKNRKFAGVIDGILNNKKIIVSVISVLLIIYIGILGGEYFVKAEAKVNDNKTNVNTNMESKNKENNVPDTNKENSQNTSSEKTSQSNNIDENNTNKSSNTAQSGENSQKKSSSNNSKKTSSNSENIKNKDTTEKNTNNDEKNNMENNSNNNSPSENNANNNVKQSKNSIYPNSGENSSSEQSNIQNNPSSETNPSLGPSEDAKN